MIYQVCPTCGNTLSNVVIPYTKDMEELCNEYDIDIDRISAQPMGDHEFNEKKSKIIDKYVSKDRLCCRFRLANFSDIVKLVH